MAGDGGLLPGSRVPPHRMLCAFSDQDASARAQMPLKVHTFDHHDISATRLAGELWPHHSTRKPTAARRLAPYTYDA
jgi:hypothetical protein